MIVIYILTVLWVDHLNTEIDIGDALNRWALYVVKQKVKELVFCIGVNISQSFEFPECIFNSESLTDLDLYLGSMCSSTLCLPESINLPKLKSVKFQGLHMNEVLMNEFFLSCPARLFGLFVNSLVKTDVEMIVQERRNNPYTYSELPGESKDMNAKAMMIMLEKFHNVKELLLSSRFIQDCFAEQPTDLYCDKINFPSENIEDYWKPGLTSPCETLPLKVLELVDANGSVYELWFIEVILKYDVKLEKVALYVNWDGSANLMERIMKFDEKLRSLPRASSRVSTLFY
ncbi:hypothetical protein MKX01_008372 [Papaver californicum]|nr:hypothetical protein MKX01_008372 [Papaver californicum]